MTTKTVIIACFGSFAIGAALALYFKPNKNVVKTEYKDRIVTQNHITTVTKIVKVPGGAEETTTTVIDNSKTIDNKSGSMLQETVVQKNWLVGAGAGLDTHLQPVYSVQMNRRILGPIFIGAWGTTSKSGGLSLSLEF